MTSLRRSSGSGDGGGGSSGSGGSRTSSHYGAVRWGVPGGGQMQLQRSQRKSLPPQQLRDWYASRSGGGGSSGSRCIEAAALGASESALPVTAPAEALHTFTLYSGASRCFFRDNTTLTPLSAPIPVRMADPSGGPVLARSSTVLPCPVVSSGSLTGFHLPSFSTNLVSTATLQDAMVTTTTPGGPVAHPCSCRLLSHQTLLWHHRLGHPSLPRFRGMHSRLLVSSLPRSLPPPPPSPAPPCLPCVEGRQRATPHSSSFPPTTAPLQTLHMDVWGPARVTGQGHERYFLLVVDDYTRYITVFPSCSKGKVPDVLIPWIRAVHLQLREQFRQDLTSFMLPDSPQQNGIAERRIGVVMEWTSDNAAAPHFLWPFAVRYAAHQLNLWPRVTLPETSPTLRWTGEVGDALVFWVWGSRAFVRDTSADKLSACAIPCVFLGFPSEAPGWQFYHPTSRRVIPSHNVTFDESVPFYRGPAPSGVSQVDPLLGTVPVEVAVDSGAAGGAAFGGVEPRGAEPKGAEPRGAESEGAGSGGAEPGGAEPGGAELAGVESVGAEHEGVEPGGAESEGAESGGAEPRGTTSSRGPAGASPRLSPQPEPLSPQQQCEWFTQSTRFQSGAAGAGDSAAGDTGAGAAGVRDPAEPGGAGVGGTGAGGAGAGDTGAGGIGAGGAGTAGASPRLSPWPEPLSPQQLHEWFAQHTRLWSGAVGAGDSATGDTGSGSVGVTRLGGAGVTARAGGTGGAAAGGPRGARTRGTGAAGTGSGGGAGAGDPTEPGATGAGGAGAQGTGAGGARAEGPGAVDPGAGGAGAGGAVSGVSGAEGILRSRPYFVPLLQQPASSLPTPSPNTEQVGGLTECRVPASRPTSPVRTGRRVPRLRPPPVLGTHAMTLRPSSAPLRVPLPPPPESSLPAVPDPESDGARVASPSVSRLLATVVTDPLFESTASSALVAELVEFAAACRLDYATALIAESGSTSPPSVRGECALGTDVLKDRQEDFECLAATVPRFASMLLAPEGDPDARDIPTPRSYTVAILVPYSSQWQAPMDAEMASWKSTGTYGEEPSGSSPAFKARYVTRGFSQRQGVDNFQTFSPTPKMTTLRVLLHVAAQHDYELHSPDLSTTSLQSSLHEEIWLRRPPDFTWSFRAGTQWSFRRPVYNLHQAPREWHDTPRTTLAALGFAPSTANSSLFLRTDTSQPPFYVLVYVDDLVFATADAEALTLVKSELQKRHTCTDLGLRLPVLLATAHCSVYQPHLRTSPQSRVVRTQSCLMGCLITSGMGLVLGGRGPVVLIGHADTSWVDHSAMQRPSQGYTFSLGSGSVSWRSTHSSSILSSICEAEIYAGAMAAQELRWLTYLLADMGEQPYLPPVLYVDNKAMIALCQEHRLEHRTKHISLRYFLARGLQQRGQLHLAYMATRANTADIFTKALPLGDHHRFSTVLGLLALLFLTGLVLQRFGFQFSSPQPTPLSTSHSLSAPPLDESVEPSGPYPELVGCLMYLMTCTRPDLAHPLSLLARYVAPCRRRKVHWDATKRVLRYLCSTSGMGLVLGGRGPVVLTGHADASSVDDSQGSLPSAI
ncbi:unnamed protein product [Closterium sp. NIES-53]